MKYFFTLCALLTLILVSGCSGSSGKTSLNSTGAVIDFESLEHDFGSIPYKGDGTYEFVFKNKGDEPLVLKNVRSSCGCTVPEWPRDPIRKGDKGTITVKYNTRITGSFSKSISVFSNAAEAPVVLVIKGKVEAEPKDVSAAE